MRKRLWSPEEDEALRRFVDTDGCGKWSQAARLSGLHQRCPKSCRLRWVNYLRPGLKRGPFSTQELCILLCLHTHFGNRWSQIATYMPGRSDNDVKNAWHLCRRRHQFSSKENKYFSIPTTKGLHINGQHDHQASSLVMTACPLTNSHPCPLTKMIPLEDAPPPDGLEQVVWSFINKKSL